MIRVRYETKEGKVLGWALQTIPTRVVDDISKAKQFASAGEAERFVKERNQTNPLIVARLVRMLK